MRYNTLSYREGSFEELCQDIVSGHWHYHDQTYRSPQGGIGEYGEGCELPLVFTGSMGLRRSETDLARHAFPPHEIEEYGLPGGSDEAWLPVAGSDEVAVYIELSPGRVLRIPASMMALGSQAVTGTLHTGYFAPGDSLLLAARKADPGQPARLELKAVSYGMRGWAVHRMTLPFLPGESDRDRGLLAFGAGSFCVRLPSFLSFDEGSVVVIESDTNVMSWRDDDKRLRVGDTVLLCVINERFEIAGFQNTEVESISFTSRDSDQAWLERMAVHRDYLARFVSLMGGSIPATVTSVSEGSVCLELQQPLAPGDGSVLALTPMRGDGDHHLLLRGGARLFLADMAVILGVSKELARDIIAATGLSGTTLWFRWNRTDQAARGSLRSGIDIGQNGRRAVRVLSAVDSNAGSGFLCIDVSNGELLWMPLAEACLSPTATAGSVLDILCERGILNVVVEGRLASYIKANSLYRRNRGDELARGRSKARRVYVHSSLASDARARRFVYLCYEMPRGSIYELVSETPLRVATTLDAFLQGGNQQGIFVPCDQWRTPITLSKRTLSFIDDAYRASPDRQVKTIRRTKMRQLYDPIAQPVETAWRSGTLTNVDAGADMVGLASTIRTLRDAGYSDSDPKLTAMLNKVPTTLRRFCRHLQETVASGESVCVASLLCLPIMLNELGRSIEAAALLEALKEHLWAWEVEEYLLSRWLLDRDPFSKYDLRCLLASLPLGGCETGEKFRRLSTMTGTLTEHQRERLVEVCNLVVRRRRGHARDLSYCLAICLLSAAGQTEARQKGPFASALETTAIHGLASTDTVTELAEGTLLDRLVDTCPGISADEASCAGLIGKVLSDYPSIRDLCAE